MAFFFLKTSGLHLNAQEFPPALLNLIHVFLIQNRKLFIKLIVLF